MTIVATRFSAFLTGLWTACGMGAFDAWEKVHPQTPTMQTVLFFATALVFFFIPGVLFVVGTQYPRFQIADIVTREYWIAFKDSGVRLLCWFFGAVFAGAVYSLLLFFL